MKHTISQLSRKVCPPYTILRLLLPVLLAVAITSAMLLLLTSNTTAHEAAPEAPPLLPACHPSARQCVSSAYLHADSEAAANAWAATALAAGSAPTETVAPTSALPARGPDGKWLQPMAGLALGNHRSSTPQALYNLPCEAGFADVFSCENIDLLAYMPTEEIGGQFNNDMWGWVDPADGTEYALVGARDGVVFLDLTDPTAPRYLGKLPSHGKTSSWRDIKVYRDHAFIVADFNPNHGMQIFDLTQLRSVDNPPVVFQETAHYAGFNDAHNIAIDAESGYAYAVGTDTCNEGLHMIDVSSITVPIQAGCYTRDGYIHDTQCVTYHGPDMRYQGRELCFNASVSKMTVVDVTNKNIPQRIGALGYPNSGYVHQGWLTPDQRYFILNDEFDERDRGHNTRTYLVDLAHLDAPQLIGVYTARFTSIDHNLYISDTYIYEANYTSGLRILDGKDIAVGRLQDVAGFDTFPDHDETVFAGAWTAYPYFPSGIVVVSTIDRGVFVLRPRLPADVIITERSTDDALCLPDLQSTPYTVTIPLRTRNGYTGTALLSVDAESSDTPTALASAIVDFQARTAATETFALDLSAMTVGKHMFTATVEAPDATILDEVAIQIHGAETTATPPTLIGPTTPLTQAGSIRFTWQPVATAHRYRLDVATDASFKVITASTVVEEPTYLLHQPLDHNRRYHWRVVPLNGCGAGVAAAGEFRTATAIFLPLVRR